MNDTCTDCGKVHSTDVSPHNYKTITALSRVFSDIRSMHLAAGGQLDDAADMVEMVNAVHVGEMLALLDVVLWAHANPVQIEMLRIEVGQAAAEQADLRAEMIGSLYTEAMADRDS